MVLLLCGDSVQFSRDGFLKPIAGRWLASLVGIVSQLVCQVESFCQQSTDAALAFGNVVADLKLAVDSHVVDRVQLHAVRVQFSWVSHAAGFLVQSL